MGVTFFSDMNDLCEEHPDIVVLASSILSAKQVLESIPVQRLRRSTLFVDVLSVKLFPKQLMLAELPPEVPSYYQHHAENVHSVESAQARPSQDKDRCMISCCIHKSMALYAC